MQSEPAGRPGVYGETLSAMTYTLTIEVPEGAHLSEFDLRMTLAARLYEQGRLSLGHAAAVANLSKRAFIELLGTQGVSLFSTSIEDLQHDLAST